MSPWASPIVAVKKHTPEGSPQQFRLWMDYRKLNSLLPAITPKSGNKKGTLILMPLPKIDELFGFLKGIEFFTALDIQIGYYHIKLDEESIPKSAFMTVFGKFKFLGLPFRLCQGPDFFIRLIYDLFVLDKSSHNSPGSGYLTNLDDILIYSNKEEKHLDMIKNAFGCLWKASLKIKLSKCSFFKKQIQYLSHLVSGTSILPLADKIEALMNLKPPTNIKEVRNFLSLTGYYRKFICNYTDIAHPQNCLTQISQPLIWTPDCQTSFKHVILTFSKHPNCTVTRPQ